MQATLGIICIVLGMVGWGGQLVSAVAFRRAQRWKLQEKNEHTDPLFRTAELHAARWDALVLWTLIAAGVLMVVDHAMWPLAALVAGGIHLDAGGREAAKHIAFRKQSVRVGAPVNIKLAYGTFLVLALIGLVLIFYALINTRA